MKKDSRMSPMMQQYLELKERYKDCINNIDERY